MPPPPPEGKPEKPPVAYEDDSPTREEVMWDTKFLVEQDKNDGAADGEEGKELRDKKYKQALMKNKQLLVMLEKERTARMKCEREIKEFQQVLNAKTPEDAASTAATKDANPGSEQELKLKCAKFEKKLAEERSKNFAIKNDLEKALKIIKKEIGEFDSLDKLANTETWKGRAQEIEILKGKLRDYQNLNKSTGMNELASIKKR